LPRIEKASAGFISSHDEGDDHDDDSHADAEGRGRSSTQAAEEMEKWREIDAKAYEDFKKHYERMCASSPNDEQCLSTKRHQKKKKKNSDGNLSFV